MLFGTPIDTLDAAAIERAVADQVGENEQLDWKRDPYKSGDGAEIAKDIAALANALGGVIIIGVDETDGVLTTTPYRGTADAAEKQIRQASMRIQPFHPVDVRPIPAGPEPADGRYIAIIVARSPNAPHAVVTSGDKPQLSFPVRNGVTTRYLSEAELGPRYRDRYAARTDLAKQLDTIHARGYAETGNPQEWWLSVACLPTEPGARQPGPAARTAELEFLTPWTTDAPPPRSIDINPLAHPPMPAVGRTIFSDSRDRTRKSRAQHVELGHDGSGMCARCLWEPPAHRLTTSCAADDAAYGQIRWVASSAIEWALFTSMLLLADHAIDTGAAGDLEFIAQLHPPTNTAAGICVPTGPRRNPDRVELYGENLLSTGTTTPSRTTVPIGDRSDLSSIAQGAFTIGTDLLAEHAIDEPRILTPDGQAITTYFDSTFGHDDWARENLNTSDGPPNAVAIDTGTE